MQDTIINNSDILNAAAVIQERGSKNSDGSYTYKGITLSIGHDGYDMTLSNNKVSMEMHFHNTKTIRSTSSQDYDLFYKQLVRISENH